MTMKTEQQALQEKSNKYDAVVKENEQLKFAVDALNSQSIRMMSKISELKESDELGQAVRELFLSFDVNIMCGSLDCEYNVPQEGFNIRSEKELLEGYRRKIKSENSQKGSN